MNSIRLTGLFVALLSIAGAMNAATFTVYNKNAFAVLVTPVWDGHGDTYYTVPANGSKFFDSGHNEVHTMRWVFLENKCPMKAFKANIKIGKINLGGDFSILNDGAYSYFFGIDGRDSNVGGIPEYPFSRK